jgi:hypothetical protein
VAEHDELTQAKVRKRKPKQWHLSGVKRWRELGFLVLPKHDREGELALCARNFVDGLTNVQQVRGMLALGRGSTEIACWLKQENPQEATIGLKQIRDYLAHYRKFFVSPLDAVRASAEIAGGSVLTNADGQVARQYRDHLLGAVEKVKEVTALETVLDMQLERLKAARETEKNNLGGFLMPSIYREMEVVVKAARELVDMKSELGYSGYLRIPRVIDVNARVQMPDVSQLSDAERASIKEFSDQFLELIKLSASEDEMWASADGVFQVDGQGGKAD